jgi:hypothetical protein
MGGKQAVVGSKGAKSPANRGVSYQEPEKSACRFKFLCLNLGVKTGTLCPIFPGETEAVPSRSGALAGGKEWS